MARGMPSSSINNMIQARGLRAIEAAGNINGLSSPGRHHLYISTYTPYEGLNIANQKTRKLGVFGRKLRENPPHFIIISMYIPENETNIFK